MPVPSYINNSPSCKFKLIFCSLCKDGIQPNLELKCDNCNKFFHNKCLTTGDKNELNDLILLCHDCENDKTICSKKDQLDIKSKGKMKTPVETLARPITRKLRPRAISVDYFGTHKQRKVANSKPLLIEKQYEELLQKMDNMQTQIDKLENRKCDCYISIEKNQLMDKREHNNPEVTAARAQTISTGDHITNNNIIDALNVNTKNESTRSSISEEFCSESFTDTQIHNNNNKNNAINEKMNHKIEIKAINKKIVKIDGKLLDLAIFEKSNNEGLVSIAANVNENENKINNVTKSLDTCNALLETNMTALIEIQKTILEHSARMDEFEMGFRMNGEHDTRCITIKSLKRE